MLLLRVTATRGGCFASLSRVNRHTRLVILTKLENDLTCPKVSSSKCHSVRLWPPSCGARYNPGAFDCPTTPHLTTFEAKSQLWTLGLSNASLDAAVIQIRLPFSLNTRPINLWRTTSVQFYSSLHKNNNRKSHSKWDSQFPVQAFFNR